MSSSHAIRYNPHPVDTATKTPTGPTSPIKGDPIKEGGDTVTFSSAARAASEKAQPEADAAADDK
jgi:hypothetical protein